MFVTHRFCMTYILAQQSWVVKKSLTTQLCVYMCINFIFYFILKGKQKHKTLSNLFISILKEWTQLDLLIVFEQFRINELWGQKLTRWGNVTACTWSPLFPLCLAQGLDHIAENILSFLDARSLCAAELVCKEWQRVISEGMLWKKLIERMVRTDPLWKGLSERHQW